MDTTFEVPSLTANDRCDGCGAQAYVQVYLIGGELLFCGHHYKENEHKLVRDAIRIHDEMHKLIPTKPEIEDVE